MSIVGRFGVCQKSKYNQLDRLLKSNASNASAEAENLMKGIYSEIEASAESFENDKCSGEVFIAVYEYLKTSKRIDVRCNLEKFGQKWREVTGDFDVIVFDEKDRLISLGDSINDDEISQFLNSFFQMDFGNTGQIACETLFNNLKSVKEDEVLIWHLFPRAMSQSPKNLDECREGQIPRSLLRIKLDTPSACCGVFDFSL